MRVTIHQPDFMPWLGFFERWRNCDLYIVLDDVQFLRRGWHNRDKIKTPQGAAWLTVPVQQKGHYTQTIRDTMLDGDAWKRKHLATIRATYSKAPCFGELFPGLEAIYARPHSGLVEFNIELLLFFAFRLGIRTPMTFASEARIQESGTARLVQLCLRHNADVYITGTGSRGYLEENLFAQEGIQVEWQEFLHPTYPQLHGRFIPGLSILDSMMMGQPANTVTP